MSAAAPPPTAVSPPTAAPATAPASKPAAPPPKASPPRPRVRELHDSGTVRKESVDADRWFASGLVKVTGDANLGEGKLDGTVSIGGHLNAATARYHGGLEVDGAVEVSGALTGTGTLGVGSTLRAGTAELKGSVRVHGTLTVDRSLKVNGSLAAPSATVGELDLEGEARIPGDLTAFRVQTFLKENSSFGTVRARAVTLKGKPTNLVEKVFFRHRRILVERVEADEAEFEAVEVTFVRAPKITLGRDAHLTEYEGTIVKQHPSSRVGFESKSEPPYGLRR